MESNEQLLAKLDTALKSITEISTEGTSVLAPEKQAQFIEEMQESTVLLPAARYVAMGAQRVDIDRTGFSARILKSGRDAKQTGSGEPAGAVYDPTGGYGLSAGFVTPSFATNQLNARELIAVTSIRDDALRRNLERGGFESTLIALFGKAAGRDLEEFGVFGDTTLTYAQDDMLSQTDGWIRSAGQILYGVGADKDFDPAAEAWPENLFTTMLDALPKRFFGDPNAWNLYVDWAIYDGYRDLLRARGTPLGDAAQVGNIPLMFKGINIVYLPVLERHTALRGAAAVDLIEGRAAILCQPSNAVWGVFSNVSIEREREAKQRRTDFVLSFEGDVTFENEDAVVAALIEKDNPA